MAKRKTTVLFIWQPEKRLKEYLLDGLKEIEDIKLIFPDDTEEETLLKYAPEADIIIGWRPTDRLLEKAEKLSLFINPGAGAQHLIELFREQNKKKPVTLINGHGNAYFTAQHTVALLLALAGKLIPHHNWMKEGLWRRGDDHAASIPIRDRKIGLLGYGAVNRKVHRMLSGFDVSFAVLRRDWKKDTGEMPTAVEKYDESQLHQFLKAVDTLIIAVPQTSKTVGLIGGREFDLLGEKALLVNVARGTVIDEKALYIALNEKKILGAAIDVWYEYRPEPDAKGHKFPFHHPFPTLDNIILSPHRAASPFSDLKRWDEVIENVTRYASGSDDFINIVDLEEEY